MSDFSVCAIIPIFNHSKTINQVVNSLLSQHLDCIIVDDGSDNETQQILDKLAQEHSQITLHRLSKNQGKGAAVMVGLKIALKQQFTHALQIDADGQHNFEDVGKIIELGKQYPQALISGHPIYDESVPKARLYSRYVTHFWVWVETLSFQIKDSMCGFRLYPLQPSFQLIHNSFIGTRMDFDTEIMVKLFWQNVPIVQFPTKVIYPSDGLSHFRAFKDNWAISKMHTRLFFGMLIRSPKLIKNRLKKKGGVKILETHWSQHQERGSHLGLSLLLRTYALLGRKIFMFFLYPVIVYFFITGKKARMASQSFLQKVYLYDKSSFQRKPDWRDSLNHFLHFGRSNIDKIASWMGEIDDKTLCFDHPESFNELMASGSGAVFIGSHLGNLELCRALSKTEPNLKLNVIAYSDNAKIFNAELKRINPSFTENLIQISTIGPDTAILLKEKINQGEVLVIVADRTSTTIKDSTVAAPFLGQQASFPVGPFVLGSIMECPVYLIFCVQEGEKYKLHFEQFSQQIILPRKKRKLALQMVLNQYAERLQHYVLKYPLQWFNFFDFWKIDKRTMYPDTKSSSYSEK